MPDDDTTQADEQPADDQPAEQSEEQPVDSDQPAEQSDEQPAESDQPAEQPEGQPAESDQPAGQTEDKPADSDQPVEQSEEQPSGSDQPAEPSEEQPAESDQSAATASTDNTVALAGGDAPPSGGGGGGSGGSRPSKDVVVKNERAPADPLPANFVPEGYVEKHRVSDGEDWASVAAKYNIKKVADLINFNFHTNNPDEVNWYLRRNTGCNVSKDGGVNWAFSSSAVPGFIYIPRSDAIKDNPTSPPSSPTGLPDIHDPNFAEEFKKWAHVTLTAGHGAAALIEVASFWTAEGAVLFSIAEFTNPIGYALMLTDLFSEVIKAFGEGLKREKNRGFIFGLIWEQLGKPNIPWKSPGLNAVALPDDPFHSDEESAEAFNEGVQEGRAKGREPEVQYGLGMAIAGYMAKQNVSIEMAANLVLNELFRQAGHTRFEEIDYP